MTNDAIKVYTAKDVQEMLQCSKSQTYKLMNDRIFPSFKIGKRLYVRHDDLEKFLKQATQHKRILQ